MPTAEEAIEELIATRPPVHEVDGQPQDWGLTGDALRWLARHLRADWRTLETGCGHSTILFALTSAQHVVVAPFREEHERAREWCSSRGFSTDALRSVIATSQEVLPGLEGDQFDFALIDGGHAFPLPFIDWYYVAVRLRVGGCVMIDDMHLKACSLLRDFLLSEKPRWKLVADLDRAVVFEKLEHAVIPHDDWAGQPWFQDADIQTWRDLKNAKEDFKWQTEDLNRQWRELWDAQERSDA